jgi:hypothetical protein
LSFGIQSNDKGAPEAQCEVVARRTPPGITAGAYDTDAYDSEKEYS